MEGQTWEYDYSENDVGWGSEAIRLEEINVC